MKCEAVNCNNEALQSCRLCNDCYLKHRLKDKEKMREGKNE